MGIPLQHLAADLKLFSNQNAPEALTSFYWLFFTKEVLSRQEPRWI